MRNKTEKLLTAFIIVLIMNSSVFAESLFRANVSQNAYPIQPRSLFSTVKARSIGDLVTVVVDEVITTSDDMSLDTSKTSSTTDKFSPLINKIFPFTKAILPPELSNFGGNNKVANTTKVSRKSTVVHTITAQVVQILPNGNLVVQGKKTEVNSGETMEFIISGVIDPRLLDSTGSIKSNLVANLQVAVVGKGTVSRSDTEGTVNKFIRYLF
jgi:flagellar L-ring protein precursor FlgH